MLQTLYMRTDSLGQMPAVPSLSPRQYLQLSLILPLFVNTLLSSSEEKDGPNKCVFCQKRAFLNVCQQCMFDIDCCGMEGKD